MYLLIPRSLPSSGSCLQSLHSNGSTCFNTKSMATGKAGDVECRHERNGFPSISTGRTRQRKRGRTRGGRPAILPATNLTHPTFNWRKQGHELVTCRANKSNKSCSLLLGASTSLPNEATTPQLLWQPNVLTAHNLKPCLSSTEGRRPPP
jgi:hypothetical protein